MVLDPYRAVLALPQRLTLRSRMFLPKRRSTIAELQLQKANDGLRTEIVNLRHELTNKQGYAERLEVLLRERMERIDELTATIDQLRERNKRLEAEAEHLAKIAANRPADYPTHLGNILRDAFERARKLKLGY